MKTILILIISSILSLHLIAQDSKAAPWAEYCAKLRDGKIIVLADGAGLTSDVTLENGTIIRADGTVIKPDGTKLVLKDGECMDGDTKTIEPKRSLKTKKEKSK